MKDCTNPALAARFQPLAAGELDWICMETTCWPRDGAADVCRSATLLVSFDPAAPAGGLALTGDEDRGVHCHRGRGDLLAMRPWASRRVEFAVLYVRGSVDGAASRANALAAEMKREGVGHVSLVCADARTRRAVPRADSFIVGSVGADLCTAAVVADMLHNVLLAPAMLNCLDIDDLPGPIGSADHPAVVAEALHRWHGAAFEFVDAADEAAFQGARGISLMLPPSDAQVREVATLVTVVRDRLAGRDVHFTFGAPRQSFHPTGRSTRVALVRLLCMP